MKILSSVLALGDVAIQRLNKINKYTDSKNVHWLKKDMAKKNWLKNIGAINTLATKTFAQKKHWLKNALAQNRLAKKVH